MLQNLAKPRCYGFSPIPEWTDEEICDIERRDVHGSRCRCQYCADRSIEIAVQRADAAQREADKIAEAAAAEVRRQLRVVAREEQQARRRREEIELLAKAFEPEVRYLTGEELLEFLEYRYAETTLAKFRSTGKIRSA